MAFPKFKPDFKHAMLGVGALAIAALPLVSGPSSAEDAREIPTSASSISAMPTFSADDREIPGFTTTDFKATTAAANTVPAAATTVNYQEWDLPTPQTPTADRPYHYVRFDQSIKGEYSGTPLMMNSARPDLLVVLNFIDEQNDYSERQTELLEGALTYLAPRSEAKELMLVDIVVRDEQGNRPYGNEYTNVYEANSLGPDGASLPEYTLPYGVIRGEELVAGQGNTLYDFSIYANARNERDLLENSRSIAASLQGFVTAYNQKKVASLDSAGPATLFAANN